MDTDEGSDGKIGCGCAPGLGGALSFILSYKLNASILWALLHTFTGGLYLIWAALMRTEECVAIAHALRRAIE
jgi:hypothetical protein